MINQNTIIRETLEWYGEQARLARLIHSEGDSGRWALSEDGGRRAGEALSACKTHCRVEIEAECWEMAAKVVDGCHGRLPGAYHKGTCEDIAAAIRKLGEQG